MVVRANNTTDRLLADSFKELAQIKPVEKITIKEITDKAGVIRPTFYNHFQDKYELLEWIIRTEVLEPTYPLIHNGLANQALLLIFTCMEHEKPFYSRISRMDGPITFEELVAKCIKEFFVRIIKEAQIKDLELFPFVTEEVLAEYYAKSMIFSVKIWIQQGMNVPPQKMADLYEYLMNHSLEDILHGV